MNTPTLEEQLINEIQNFLLPGVVFTPSDEIATHNGTYVVDATLKLNDSTVVIERGDKEDKKELATEILDLWKDAFLIHQGGVDKVYRFAKREIEGFLPDIIHLLGKELPEFFDYSTIKRRPSRFLDFFYRIDPIRYHNKKTIEFLDPEQQNMRYSERESGFHYYYADGHEWFPDYGPEALLLGELYPNKNAQELYGIYGGDDAYRYGGLFEQLEEEKPGALGKYIRYFRDYYHYVDKKGELIKKYKQLAGYPLAPIAAHHSPSAKEFSEQNLPVWNRFVDQVTRFGNENKTQWKEKAEISLVLEVVLKLSTEARNHILFFIPGGGSFYPTKINESLEDGFTEFHASSVLSIAKVASVEFVSVEGWPDQGYFKVNFEAVAPIPVPSDIPPHWKEKSQRQVLLEYAPGKYDYSSSPIREMRYAREVERYTDGYFVLFRNGPLQHPIFSDPVLSLQP